MIRGPALRKGELPLQLVLAFGTLYLAYAVVAPMFLLVYQYGWTRVHEHLRILAMPKHQPWPVSNGDTINHPLMHYLFGLASWFAMMFATYPWVRLLLPKRS